MDIPNFWSFLPNYLAWVGLWVTIFQNYGQITTVLHQFNSKIVVKLVLWLWLRVVPHILIGFWLWLRASKPHFAYPWSMLVELQVIILPNTNLKSKKGPKLPKA